MIGEGKYILPTVEVCTSIHGSERSSIPRRVYLDLNLLQQGNDFFLSISRRADCLEHFIFFLKGFTKTAHCPSRKSTSTLITCYILVFWATHSYSYLLSYVTCVCFGLDTKQNRLFLRQQLDVCHLLDVYTP